MRSTVLGALAATLVVTAASLGASGATNAAGAASATTLRVGSFNLSSISFDTQSGGDHAPWKQRRNAIAQQILDQGLDVVGVQEANPSSIYKSRLVDGANQFSDVKNALNELGGHWALTNSYPYNCVKATSQYKCVYKNRGASLDNRILYNTDTVALVNQGAMQYKTQTAGKYPRNLEWATLAAKSTGQRFLFTNTHLDPYSNTTRLAQWKQALAKTAALRGSLPVIAVGDYNTSKFDTNARTMLPMTKAQNLGDVLNSQYATNPLPNVRAQSLVNGYFGSFNGFRRSVTTYCYCARQDKIGNNIDWIFASNNIVVDQWAVVMNLDPSRTQLVGVIPSDHNLVRATLTF